MHDQDRQLKQGAIITVQALRTDGTCYRWWPAAVERVHDDAIVTNMPVGTVVEASSGGWVQQHYIRAFYWFDRPYNLLEVYRSDGALVEIYIHIASPAYVRDTTIRYIDHELDVVMSPGESPRIVDEEEFTQAVVVNGYSPVLQAACRAAALEALQVAASWQAGGIPTRASA